MLNVAELGEYFDSRLRESAFRLELLDRYDVESDGGDFERYVRGEPGPDAERKQPWLDELRRERQAGILRHRVHMLTRPLTDYLRYECEWGYVPNAEAGEVIKILDVSEKEPPAGLVDHDFWLIDDRYAIRMHYDEGCRYVGAEPADEHLAAYQHARDVAIAAAEPFDAWWARHPEEWRENRLA
jgi:hypothetical protein